MEVLKLMLVVTVLVLVVTVLVLSNNANSALLSRLGGLAYYDDVANLTWLADANAAAGSAYDTFIPGTGRVNWTDANAWAANLDVAAVTGSCLVIWLRLDRVDRCG